MIGLERPVIGTVVERATRFTILVHLPREPGYRHKKTPKNGPAPAGCATIAMKDALAKSMSTLPEQLRRTLAWDRGKELSAHAQFTIATDIPVFFADPQSPWQRATNENINGLRTGNASDNAPAESFFPTLQHELIDRRCPGSSFLLISGRVRF